MRLASAWGLTLVLVADPGCKSRDDSSTGHVVEPTTSQSAARVDVTGRLLYADGTPAAGVPYELVASERSEAGTTGAQGELIATALLSQAAVSVDLRLLDGFGVGLVGDRNGLGSTTLAIPHVVGQRLEDAYLLAVPKAMAMIRVPKPASASATRAVARLDLVGSHGDAEILTPLAPRRIPELRELGIEVLVLDVDANHYAVETGPMTDAERVRHIDARMRAAQAELAKVPRTRAIRADPKDPSPLQ